MTPERPAQPPDLDAILRPPAWITSRRPTSLEDAAFFSGAALGHLHVIVQQPSVPHAVWRDRLALQAAEACVAFSGRPERAQALRDVVHLLRPGDLPGPAGETCLSWHRAAERSMSIKALQRALPDMNPQDISRLHATPKQAQDGAVRHAAQVLELSLIHAPLATTSALILGDAALAGMLGQKHLTPLLAQGLKGADLRKRGEDLRMACHMAVTASMIEAARLASDLARRAQRLHAVAPKLRAKQAGGGVLMFLSQDAVAPSALPLSDRAARRLCDRLVALGAIRELTGRDTFRLYGL